MPLHLTCQWSSCSSRLPPQSSRIHRWASLWAGISSECPNSSRSLVVLLSTAARFQPRSSSVDFQFCMDFVTFSRLSLVSILHSTPQRWNEWLYTSDLASEIISRVKSWALAVFYPKLSTTFFDVLEPFLQNSWSEAPLSPLKLPGLLGICWTYPSDGTVLAAMYRYRRRHCKG